MKYFLFLSVLILLLHNCEALFKVLNSKKTITPAKFVEPLSTLNVKIEYTIQHDLSGGLSLTFIGSSNIWDNANIACDQISNENGVRKYVCTKNIATPGRIGIHSLSWRPKIGTKNYTAGQINHKIEVTCDDGIFCNGQELFINGRCLSATRRACDDGFACNTDICNEEEKRCSYQTPSDCGTRCARDCIPQCQGKTCGSDSCGYTCGTCSKGQVCAEGVCKTPTSQEAQGTCLDPLPLLSSGLLGTHTITGSTKNRKSNHEPSCGSSGSPDIAYTFTVPSNYKRVVMDARVTGFDSVLELRRGDCVRENSTLECNDDGTPVITNGGSRIFTTLYPSKYYLIVEGFSRYDSGSFQLQVKFTQDGCVPECRVLECGDDGCGGSCGTCQNRQVCNTFGQCEAKCTPYCDGIECGDDGCGGSCGTCKGEGNFCYEIEGKCKKYPICNHLLPTCSGCTSNQYCGTDCLCKDKDSLQPDVVVNSDMLASSVTVEYRTFANTTCALYEKCIGKPGLRKLLKFSVGVLNQGFGALKPPGPPYERPDLFEFSACHQHYHFKDFAVYQLLSPTNRVIIEGRKQSFCMYDSDKVLSTPASPCNPVSSCANQAIHPGWQDVYDLRLDCQWIDVTSVPPGNYRLKVGLNTKRVFHETNFRNNEVVVPVKIP